MPTLAPSRHCEERSDAAIHDFGVADELWIAAPYGLAMTIFDEPRAQGAPGVY